MLDVLAGLWHWVLSLCPDKALCVWLFEKPKADDDLTFLCCIFTLNVGLSLVDDLRNSLARRLREVASGGSVKSRTANWMRKLGKLDGRRYGAQKRHLQKVVGEALAYNEKIPALFVYSGDFFKWLMVVAAGASLWCMIVPNTDRITMILALPFFIYLFWCLFEFGCFFLGRMRKFRRVDTEFAKVEDQSEIVEESDSLRTLLEKLNANITELNRRFPSASEDLGTVDHEKLVPSAKRKKSARQVNKDTM